MKKMFAAALALTMAALTACGGSSAPATTAAPAATTAAPAAADTTAAAAAAETDWPTGTVNVTVPYNAGGDTDTYYRALFDRIAKKTGQNFVVTNLTGGSGMVAAMDVMQIGRAHV